MVVDGNVSCAGIEVRWLNSCNGAPRHEILDALCDVGPVGAAVLRVPDEAVVRAGPDEALLNFRRRDGKDNFAIKLPEIVADDSAGGAEIFWVLRGKIRADDRPALSAIACFENDLAA